VSVVSVVCCQKSAPGRSLVQRIPTLCVCVCACVRACAPLSVIRCSIDPLHLQDEVEEVRLGNKENEV